VTSGCAAAADGPRPLLLLLQVVGRMEVHRWVMVVGRAAEPVGVGSPRIMDRPRLQQIRINSNNSRVVRGKGDP
jgi:hypothetical protein